jgi:dipeptidyl aminopeptidase/acylaminoacyl peptidase
MLALPLIALALAAAPHAMTVDDLLALPRAGDPAISPDGSQVAYTVARAAPDGARLLSTLWLVPARGGAPRQLTHAEERVRAPRFSPDGRRLAFIGTRAGSPQVFLLPLDGGEAAPAPRVPGGAGDLLWTPDGRALLVIADVDPACGADLACNEKADEAAKGRPYVTDRLLFRHWDEWRTRLRSHVLRVPLDGGPVTDLTPGDRDVPPVQRGGIDDVAVSPDGKTVYVVWVSDPVEAISTNGDLYAVPMAGGEARQITASPGWDGTPRPSPDGKRLAWRRQPRAGYEADAFHVVVAAADGSGERDLTAGLDLSADELWWAGNGALRFTAGVAGRVELHEIDVASGKVTRLAELPHLRGLSPAADGRTAAVTFDALTAPHEVGLLGPAGRRGLSVRPLTRLGAAFAATVSPVAVRPLEAKGTDGATIHGWIVTPPGHREGERHPTVVMIHGGPQGAWTDDWHYRWNPMLWASQGWTVVLPNPRGSTGYGQAYTDAVRNNWGGTPYQDIMALTDAAIAGGTADGGNMCAAGASYGGYMVNWINGQTDRFRCLVTHDGDFDVAMAYYDTEELWFPEWEMGRPWETPEAFARWSPSSFVQNWKTPTLVIHGELDYRVTVTQGLATYTALQRRGIPSRLVVFPDENHWVLKPRNSRLWHEEVFGWIRRYLSAPKAP